jgi:biotin carboxyl carrier protein
MYKINVNDQYTIELDSKNGSFQLDGKPVDIDIRELNNGHLHILHQHKSYMVEVVSSATADKTAVIKIKGKLYHTVIEDQFDRLLKELGMENISGQLIAEIKAPMPGLVLSINVSEGQEVKKGDSLLVLEAMKMENMLKSTTEGIIKKINVARGDKVEKNQVLITFL